MKAVVVEIKNNYAAVLSDDGCVITVKNNGYEVGQVIQVNHRKTSYFKRIATIAASAAAFIVLSAGTWAYASPYTYISVDVNPSIEYTANRFDRVLKVKAYNDDGEELINEISLKALKNKTIEDAMNETVQQITKAGYISSSSEGGIVITTASENEEKAASLATDLQAVVSEEFADATNEVSVEAYSVGLTRMKEAKELGVTPGKLNLIEKLKASAANSDDIKIEEWLNKSIRDIMKATKENKKGTISSDPAISTKEQEPAGSKIKKETPPKKNDRVAKIESQKKNDKVTKTESEKKNNKITKEESVKENNKITKEESEKNNDNISSQKIKEKKQSKDKNSASNKATASNKMKKNKDYSNNGKLEKPNKKPD